MSVSIGKDGQRNHVLILDDEEDARTLLSRLAAESGYAVSLASNKDEFILKFSLAKPTLLVLDVCLGLDNVETIFKFLHNQRYVEPVILVSGYAIREMDLLVASALRRGILITGLYEKSSIAITLRRQLDIYFRGRAATP